ncbi:MAG: acyltransferase domain-containing protein [Candidatus Omnitrophica bacterium]|nr:acyltransferase domain-containing protein [Candidatus Omnitrophota bacterium]MBD3269689.1 acyltransferase domain-containing protein [Candidatus Omnitrophota bacterium]
MKKAIIFPGQGSQYSGMGRELYDNSPRARDIFHKIDEICGFSLSSKCFEAGADELKDTSVQQLAILAVSIAAFEVFRESRDIDIDFLSGLSLGEYTCIYAGGVVSLEDVIVLVRERAAAMADAGCRNPSAMLAIIGIERKRLQQLAEEIGFFIANINSPNQVVISLSRSEKEKIKGALEPECSRIVELDVSGGFHSPFMDPAKNYLENVMSSLEFRDSSVPIVSNFTSRPHIKASEIKNNLLKQLVSPVLWNDCVEYMTGEGVGVLFEIGPSKVLRGLVRKIRPGLKVVNIEKNKDLENLDI